MLRRERQPARFAQKGETVKIALIDPLSGLFADGRHRTSSRAASSWPRTSTRRTRPASSSRSSASTTRLSPQESAERAQGRHRPGLPLRHAGQRLGRRRWRIIDARRQAQRAQPGQGNHLPELRGGRPGADQREVQLLALPPRRRHLDEDGGADHLHEGPARGQEGLPASTRTTRTASRSPSTPRKTWTRKRPDVADRRRRPAPAGPGASDFAPYVAKIKAVGRRHRHHRQLGLRPDAADQGGQRRGPERSSSTPTTPASPARPRRMGAGVGRQGLPGRLQPLQHGRRDGASCMAEFKKKFNDDFYTVADLQRASRCWARPWPRPSRPTR